MFVKTKRLDLILSQLSSFRSALNFYDCLNSSTRDYLKDYSFFINSDSQFFGLSPENNLHYYGGSDEVFNHILDFLESNGFKPEMIFSHYSHSNDRLIQKKIGYKPRPFYFMQAMTPLKAQTIELNFRRANPEDQSHVDDWYKKFNAEANSNWPTPKVSDHESSLYLLFLDNSLVGAAANTLPSADRFWVGRMWINPDFRKKGIGSILLQRLISESNKQKKTLSLLVNTDNLPALALYQKFGLKVLSENCIWYR